MEIPSKLPGIIARGTETGEWQELSLWIQEEASYIFTQGDLAAHRPLPFTEMEPLFNFWRKPPPVSNELLFEIAVFCEGEWRRFDSEAQTWLMDHIFDLFSSENINPEDYLVVLVDTVSIYFDERRAANVFLALLKAKDENQRAIATYGLSSLAIKVKL